MPELRQDPTTAEWVIVAPERDKRPSDWPKRTISKVPLPDYEVYCPFCPGNEDQAPDEVFSIPVSKQRSDWALRVVLNRFPALASKGETTNISRTHFFHNMNGVGVHEVVIETPSHNTPIARMPYQQVERILVAYQNRYNSIKLNDQLRYITIFKNHGRQAGTSLVHPHSQIVATPIPTPYYQRKFEIAFRHFNQFGKCIYCELIAEELKQRDRIVTNTDDFVCFHPYASHTPWETWIIPKKHYPSFGDLPAEYLKKLAVVLRDALRYLYEILDDPAFNLMIDTTSTNDEKSPYYHWHIRIMPRLIMTSGFEMGSGINVTTISPEETASLMKQGVN